MRLPRSSARRVWQRCCSGDANDRSVQAPPLLLLVASDSIPQRRTFQIQTGRLVPPFPSPSCSSLARHSRVASFVRSACPNATYLPVSFLSCGAVVARVRNHCVCARVSDGRLLCKCGGGLGSCWLFERGSASARRGKVAERTVLPTVRHRQRPKLERGLQALLLVVERRPICTPSQHLARSSTDPTHRSTRLRSHPLSSRPHPGRKTRARCDAPSSPRTAASGAASAC